MAASASCIDLLLTNKKSLLMRSAAFESGLPDFYRITTAML